MWSDHITSTDLSASIRQHSNKIILTKDSAATGQQILQVCQLHKLPDPAQQGRPVQGFSADEKKGAASILQRSGWAKVAGKISLDTLFKFGK